MRSLLALLITFASFAVGAERSLIFDLEVAEGSGDDPMIVLWVETDKGVFVKTVQMFSKDKKYYPDITTWAKSREGKEANLDGVVGPTIASGAKRSLTVPVKSGAVDLLAGNLVLRIEQRKDKGGHFKSFKLPLPADFKGGEVELDTKKSYLKKITISVKDA